MRNCMDCMNYKSSYGTQPDGYILIYENLGSILGNKYAKCEAGHNAEMKAWWNENGNIPKAETKEMSCYVPNEIDRLLDKLDDILNS